MSQPTRACPACHTPLPGMASFCYVCGTATPAGLNRETGEPIPTVTRSGIGPADLLRKLQRALGPGYELQNIIGAGGFAEVFRARDLRLKRDLAVKVLRPDLGLSPELLQRFRREAETIAALRNPHIVPVYDIGEAEGLAYLIMPLISGESLRAVIDREGAMPTAEVRRILHEAALGLAAAHDAGVIHRDVKPENIMLEGRQKRVLLMDFGIAKAVGLATDGDPAAALTTTGVIIGTPQYMSPEQASGDKSIDARTDQYSLAVVGYRMLAGRLPFEGNSTRSVLYQQMVAEADPVETKVPGVPPGLAYAIKRGMAKEPADRFADMLEFSAMLDATSIPTAEMPALQRKKRRNVPAIGAAATAVAILAIGGGWWLATRSSGGRAPASGPVPPAAAVATQPAGTQPAGTQAAGTQAAGAPGTGTAATATPATVSSPATNAAAPGGAGTTGPVTAPQSPARTATAADSIARGAKPGGKNAAALKADSALAKGKRGARDSSSTRASRRGAPASGGTNSLTCVAAAAAANWTAAATSCAAEANAGKPSAQRMLGMMYDKGVGVTASPADAVSWYRRAATANDPEAEFLLSQMLDAGRGVAANPAESFVYLRKAAEDGWLRAQQFLAARLENGTGTKKNEQEAAQWYRRAAERGDMASQQKLAEFLSRGRGVPKNETEALDWYRKAAEQGSANAAWQVSQIYFKGRGAAKDEAAGLDWLKKAAALNQPDALKELRKRGGA